MANLYRAPGFVLEHLAALPTSALSASASLVSGRGVERLADYRQQPPMEFASAAAGLFVDTDLGSAQTVGALFIPAPHNLSGTLTVSSGATQGTGTTRATTTASPGVAILLSWTGVSDRWWRITLASSGAWQIPELVFATLVRTPVRGVDDWKQPLRASVQVAEFDTFEAAAVLGPARRELELRFPNVDLAGDLAIFEQLLEIGTARPFGVVTPDNRHAAALWMRLTSDPEVEQVSPVPLSDIAYTVRLQLREQL